MVVRLWKDGFTVNDGEFRSYTIPENQEFLDAIKRGLVLCSVKICFVSVYCSTYLSSSFILIDLI